MARKDYVLEDQKVVPFIRGKIAEGWSIKSCLPEDAETFCVVLTRTIHRPKQENLDPSLEEGAAVATATS